MTSISRSPVRLRDITATEMSTLFGLNQYSSPSKLLAQKLNPIEITTNHVRRGKLKEPSVLEAFLIDANMETDRHMGPSLEMPDVRIAATPDAYVKGTTDVVECKSIISRNFHKWYDAVPLNYHVQVMVQMLVMDSKEGYIGALEEGDPDECLYRFTVWKMTRDAEFEQMMRDEATRFWAETIEGKTFRVNSKMKKRALEILPTTTSMLIPAEKPKFDPYKHESNDMSDIMELFT